MRLSSLALGLGSLLIAKFVLDLHLSSVVNSVATSSVELDLNQYRRSPSNESTSPWRNRSGTACQNIAYAFVIGGCNPENGRYLGFFYNVLVAAQRLQDEGSQADAVVLLQLSPNTTAQTLPKNQVQALEALNIRVHYIPKSQQESFYDTVLNKFRVLQLTDYCRVMLLDADVMPLGNLDYLMQLPWLRPNVIISGALEPANGGMFVITPRQGDYERIQSIIVQRALRSRMFDPMWGWGHVIEPPDQWVARRPGERGTNWTFHFAFSDQGLLYYWTKYVQRDVSIVFEDRVENYWGWSNNGTAVRLRDTIHRPFVNYSQPRLRVYAMCHKFLCDLMHFVGSKKPWLRRPPKDLSESTKNKDATYLWWYTLQQLNQTLRLGLDFNHWKVWQEAPLGSYATMPTY